MNIVFTVTEKGLNKGEYLYKKGDTGVLIRSEKGMNRATVKPDFAWASLSGVPNSHFKRA